jgi:hypothetical protein
MLALAVETHYEPTRTIWPIGHAIGWPAPLALPSSSTAVIISWQCYYQWPVGAAGG